MLNWLNKLRNDHRGAALIEFALILPVLALILFGGAEATSYVLANQKIEKAGYVLTDLTSQFQQQSAPTARTGELTKTIMDDEIFPQLARVLGSEGDQNGKQVVILTSLRKETSAGGVQEWKVKWQAASPIGGNNGNGEDDFANSVRSQINGIAPTAINGSVANTVATTLPANVATALGTLADGDNVIVGEVFVDYDSSIVPDLFPNKTLTKTVFLHPRNDSNALVCLPPDFVYPECVGGETYTSNTCQNSSYCNGPDFTTKDCNGQVVGTPVECAASCLNGVPPATSKCEGNDYVTRDCKNRVTKRVTNDTANGCYVPPVRGVCSGTGEADPNKVVLNGCTSGEAATNIRPGSCGLYDKWTCPGKNGGQPAECYKLNLSSCGACPARQPGFQCDGNILNSCDEGPQQNCTGLLQNIVNSKPTCISTALQQVGGKTIMTDGKLVPSASYAGANCPVTLAGQCGSTYNSCAAGTSANGVNSGACGTNATWNCVGANGGSTASCSISNAACAPAICAAGWGPEVTLNTDSVEIPNGGNAYSACSALFQPEIDSTGGCTSGQGGTSASTTGNVLECVTSVNGANANACRLMGRKCGGTAPPTVYDGIWQADGGCSNSSKPNPWAYNNGAAVKTGTLSTISSCTVPAVIAKGYPTEYESTTPSLFDSPNPFYAPPNNCVLGQKAYWRNPNVRSAQYGLYNEIVSLTCVKYCPFGFCR